VGYIIEMSQFTNRNQFFEQQFLENQKAPPPSNKQVLPLQKANPIYTSGFQYYTSPVQNSHIYPNMGLIRPYGTYDNIVPNNGVFLDKSIEEYKKYAIGPHILEHRDLKLYS
jgi:hypothetical protein